MTFAELFLLVAGGGLIYIGLRPVQRWLERQLISKLFGRRPRSLPPPIDVADFRTERSRRKDDHQV
jgi:hypothetical protein